MVAGGLKIPVTKKMRDYEDRRTMTGRTHSREFDPFVLWLRSRITEVGLTQEQLGERIGVSQRSVSYWCLGDRQPSGAGTLLALADTLNVSVKFLLRRMAEGEGR